MTPPEPGRGSNATPQSRRGFRIPAKLQILFIGGVAIGGIVCMAAIVVVIAINR